MHLFCCLKRFIFFGGVISFVDYVTLVLALHAHQTLSGNVSVEKKGEDFYYETVNMKFLF